MTEKEKSQKKTQLMTWNMTLATCPKAKTQLPKIQFVDAQLQQLHNEWAVSDTARIQERVEK
ncbi:MAG: hypothetical protein CM15mP54_15130 [Paracoccaceae bacterium]|nr:MAG: hypothetical protein CM15mP54_15130 [Paracoccaceae bacterium]